MSDLKTEPVKDQDPEQKDLVEFQTNMPQDSIETEKKETMPKSTFVFQSGNDRKRNNKKKGNQRKNSKLNTWMFSLLQMNLTIVIYKIFQRM